MITHFKINSELDLEWNEDPDDDIFIAILATMRHEFGLSACVVANRNHQKDVTNEFRTVGCSTIKHVTQFDVKLETSISSLREGMRVVGLGALGAYLDNKRMARFQHADLRELLDSAIVAVAPEEEQEETESLGCASPSFSS